MNNTVIVYDISDSKSCLVRFPITGYYRVIFKDENRLIHVKRKGPDDLIELDGVDSVQLQEQSKILGFYEDAESNVLTIEQYTEKEKELVKKGFRESEYGSYLFEDIDDEYEYKKFQRKYQPVYYTKTTFSENLPIIRENTAFETNNKFIKSGLSYTSHQPNIFYLDQENAAKSIITETFTRLGMTYDNDCSTKRSKTEKVWSNSKHSGIQYVVAFGEYIFGKRFSYIENTFRGSLSDCEKQYEKLKTELSHIIEYNYKLTFSPIDTNFARELVKESVLFLKSVHTTMDKMTPRVIDEKTYISLKINISNTIESLTSKISKL